MGAIDGYSSVIANPLKYVDDLFQRADSPLQSIATDWGEDHFLKRIAESVVNELRPSNSDGLVRVCGMITESKGCEFYSGVYRDPDSNVVCSGKYRDAVPYEGYDNESQRVFSREVFICSAIPGLNPWMQSANPFLITTKLCLKVMQDELPQIGDVVDIVGIRSKQFPCSVHQILIRKLAMFNVSRPISDMTSARVDLLHFIAHSLGNDYVAAQYVLMHMVSRVHCRIPEQNMVIGSCPLHLQPLSDDAALITIANIRALYSMLLPFATSLEISIDNLSSFATIGPRMDYDTEELVSGPLQLPTGTALILDQTNLEAGKLEHNALHNLHVLKRLACNQMLSYDFMYQIDFEVDIPVVVIAKEKTTLVPTQYRVSIGGVDRLPEQIQHDIDDGTLDIWRQYLASARAITVHLSSDVQEKAKQDFLKHKLNAEQMHQVLNLARLASACYLEPEITEATWNFAFELEQKRPYIATI